MKRLVAVAALVAAALPVPASGESPRGVPDRARAAREAWAEQYRALARNLPVTPLLDAVDEAVAADVYDFVDLVSAGDLDGDGAGDVADVRFRLTYDYATDRVTATLRVDARRGRDGALLWSRTVGDGASNPYMFFAPVGTAGRAGMITVVTTADLVDAHPAAVAGTATSTIAALDGAGRQLWRYDADLAGGGAEDTYAFTDATAIDVGDLVAGRATDLLVESYVFAGAGDPLGFVGVYGTLVQLQVLDGATGKLRDLGVPYTIATGESGWTTIVGDVNGDRLDDVAYVDAETPQARLRVRRSSDGGEHSATVLPAGDYHLPYRAPDVTGDRFGEVLVYSHSYDDGESPMSFVDAARGRVAWTKPRRSVFYPGDVDRRPGEEIVTNEAFHVPGGMGFRLTAVNAAGKAVWTVTRTLTSTGPPDLSTLSVTRAGDVDGDGVRDFRYTMSGAGRHQAGVVYGRTGRVRAGLPADLFSAGAALDGRGDDAFTRTVKNGVLTVGAWRGDGSGRLWRTSLAAQGAVGGTFAAPLDRDRCADLAITTRDGRRAERVTTYVLSGATGAPAWALSRTGLSAGVVTRPKARSAVRFARTC